MKDSITVERPSGKGMTVRESAYFLASWWRVMAYDGSTIAYCPDKETAAFIASALNRKMGRKIK